jgi:hypothetical protein
MVLSEVDEFAPQRCQFVHRRRLDLGEESGTASCGRAEERGQGCQ